MLTIDEVNGLDCDQFVATFGQVYESTPTLAAAVWTRLPFRDRAALVEAFRAAAAGLDEPGLLDLLRAHPQLAAAGALSAASADEQRSAGLTDLDGESRSRMVASNAHYLERFGFPFIIAVRGLEPADIAAALDARLGHNQADEQAVALAQVQRIAELRITQLVAA